MSKNCVMCNKKIGLFEKMYEDKYCKECYEIMQNEKEKERKSLKKIKRTRRRKKETKRKNRHSKRLFVVYKLLLGCNWKYFFNTIPL